MRLVVPKKFLNTNQRKLMWRGASKFLNQLERAVPISKVFVLGSFTTGKTRPADVDFIVFVKIKDKKLGSRWSADITFVPDNKFGTKILKDADKWVKQKYGLKKSKTIRIK